MAAVTQSRARATLLRILTRRFLLPGIILVVCLSSAVGEQAQSVPAISRAVDQHYNSLQSSKAAFTEIYKAPGISRTEGGTVWFKKSGKMRWEYNEPREKLFLTDSQNAYFYVPGDRQARKTPLKKIDDIRSPLRFLLGKTKLEKELAGLSLAPDTPPLQAGDLVLRGIPKAMTDRVTEVLLEINPDHQITRILIQGTDGSTTDFRFSAIEEGVAVPDKFFRFTPPPGVVTIQDDQVAQ